MDNVLLRRSAGILLHPTSLPGAFGQGDLGPEADRFLDWMRAAGQSLWQVLPLHPTGPHDSPYGATSAFAGNSLLISPELLREQGFLSSEDLKDRAVAAADRDRAHVRGAKDRLLRAAWERARSDTATLEELEGFRRSPAQEGWLGDWSLFAAVKEARPGAWTTWPEELRWRHAEALDAARRELVDEIAFQEFAQWLFFRQWARAKTEANRRGIAVLGDLPIYIAHDSADVWARPELFLLDPSGQPRLVAGVPPDAFSSAGQLWGYPLYRWEETERDGFSWWVARLRHALAATDAVRIDHFRGFAAGWAVPARAENAIAGEWLPGPGRRLFDAVRKVLGEIPLVAEDLGIITPDVQALLAALDLPGMKVLQFGFSEDDSDHLPHRYRKNVVVYTGTHDNDTARGWFEALPEAERRRALDYLGGDGRAVEWDLIRAAYESVANTAVIPLQDVFGLGSEARMNTPGRPGGNWAWRAEPGDFTADRAARLGRLAELTGRAGDSGRAPVPKRS